MIHLASGNRFQDSGSWLEEISFTIGDVPASSSVSTDKAVYGYDEDIVVSFENGGDVVTRWDWIGVAPEGHGISDYVLWKYTTHAADGGDILIDGSVRFSSHDLSPEDDDDYAMPIPAGAYEAWFYAADGSSDLIAGPSSPFTVKSYSYGYSGDEDHECFISSCGCPGEFAESWCTLDNSVMSGEWCSASEDQCGTCGGVFCDPQGCVHGSMSYFNVELEGGEECKEYTVQMSDTYGNGWRDDDDDNIGGGVNVIVGDFVLVRLREPATTFASIAMSFAFPLLAFQGMDFHDDYKDDAYYFEQSICLPAGKYHPYACGGYGHDEARWAIPGTCTSGGATEKCPVVRSGRAHAAIGGLALLTPHPLRAVLVRGGARRPRRVQGVHGEDVRLVGRWLGRGRGAPHRPRDHPWCALHDFCFPHLGALA